MTGDNWQLSSTIFTTILKFFIIIGKSLRPDIVVSLNSYECRSTLLHFKYDVAKTYSAPRIGNENNRSVISLVLKTSSCIDYVFYRSICGVRKTSYLCNGCNATKLNWFLQSNWNVRLYDLRMKEFEMNYTNNNYSYYFKIRSVPSVAQLKCLGSQFLCYIFHR